MTATEHLDDADGHMESRGRAYHHSFAVEIKRHPRPLLREWTQFDLHSLCQGPRLFANPLICLEAVQWQTRPCKSQAWQVFSLLKLAPNGIRLDIRSRQQRTLNSHSTSPLTGASPSISHAGTSSFCICKPHIHPSSYRRCRTGPIQPLASASRCSGPVAWHGSEGTFRPR